MGNSVGMVWFGVCDRIPTQGKYLMSLVKKTFGLNEVHVRLVLVSGIRVEVPREPGPRPPPLPRAAAPLPRDRQRPSPR